MATPQVTLLISLLSCPTVIKYAQGEGTFIRYFKCKMDAGGLVHS